MIKACVLYTILAHYLHYFGPIKHPEIQIFIDIVEDIGFVTVIASFCSIDGFNLRWRSKVLFAICLSLALSVYAVLVTFRADIYDKSVIEITSNVSFNIHDEWSSTIRVLSMFLWKQTFAEDVKKF